MLTEHTLPSSEIANGDPLLLEGIQAEAALAWRISWYHLASSHSLASCRSGVSKPSVNQL